MKDTLQALSDYCTRHCVDVVFYKDRTITAWTDAHRGQIDSSHTVEGLANVLDKDHERECHKELFEASKEFLCPGPRLQAAIEASQKVLAQTTEKNDET